ncbi:MAG: AAA family ATPase [Planctomycetota bacterium]
MRDLVLARDGYQCTVPGCSATDDLDAHHLEWRSQGGPTHPDNEIATCDLHHGSAHNGTLIMSGSVSRGIRYTNRDGTPFRVTPPIDAEVEAILAEPSPKEERLVAPADARAHAADANAVLRTLDDIPAQVDRSWWRRFSRLFEWAARKTVLLFKPGQGADEAEAGRPEDLARNAKATLSSNGEVLEGGLASLVGHADAVLSLREAVETAKSSGDPPAAILFTGRPGLGKTTLARAFASEMGTRFHVAHGAWLEDPRALVELLMEMERGDVLFIDEIHAVAPAAIEVLYTVVEGRYVDLVITSGSCGSAAGDETRSRTVRLKVEPFTLVGATTEEARLPLAMLSRFDRRVELEPLEPAAIDTLLERAAARLNVTFEPHARALLCKASLGIPRTATRFVEEAAKAARAGSRTCVELVDAQRALRAQSLDERGLSRVQRRILQVLEERGRPLGLGVLAAEVGKTPEAIVSLYEPELLRLGLVCRTPLGRALNGRHPRPHGRAGRRRDPG